MRHAVLKSKFLLTFLQMEALEERILPAAPLVLTEVHSQGPETQKTSEIKHFMSKGKSQNGKSYCMCITLLKLLRNVHSKAMIIYIYSDSFITFWSFTLINYLQERNNIN